MDDNADHGHEATLWGVFELTLQGPKGGNPFVDVELFATFSQGPEEIHVSGFYDGEGIYKVRFMPLAMGEWTYRTKSNADELDGVAGTVIVGAADKGAHGPVRVANKHHFAHADGTRFINIGTTAYAWNHQGEALEGETLATLAKAPFTKIRMCVFPKHYRYNETEPSHYPFALLTKGESQWPATIESSGWKFDFDRFEPAYFRHLETRIADLARIGVEADLIIFHPYDRWGFSAMSGEQDDRYLRYLVARLSAFANVWWSIANEYDLMRKKTHDDWARFIQVVADADPFDHLLSVHNCFAFYDHNHPQITHASIQRPDPERSLQWRREYGKPVSIDECCYEGDIAEAWGNISGKELVHRYWEGTVNGGYVTHGETYGNETDTIWWAKGGRLIGESVERIAFLRQILEDGPAEGIDPMEFTGPYVISAAGGFDRVTMPELFAVPTGQEDWQRVHSMYAIGGQPHRYYLTYFGRNQPSELAAAVPPDERYRATLIDTWEMTKMELAANVARGQILTFEAKPYQAVLFERSDT